MGLKILTHLEQDRWIKKANTDIEFNKFRATLLQQFEGISKNFLKNNSRVDEKIVRENRNNQRLTAKVLQSPRKRARGQIEDVYEVNTPKEKGRPKINEATHFTVLNFEKHLEDCSEPADSRNPAGKRHFFMTYRAVFTSWKRNFQKLF